MSFLQPLFLLGLLAIAVPVIIHLINRQKAVRRPFPALKLLEKSRQKEARSIKVRQWLLLALRIAAVALLAFALAKPYVLSSKGLTAEERLPSAVVFVVDDAFHMEYGDWWEKAGRQMDRELAGLRPWDEATFITMTSATANQRMTSDHGQLRRAFAQVEAGQRTGDLLGSLVAASELLAASQLPNRRIVVVSALTEGSMVGRAERDVTIPHDLEFISIRRDGEDDNLGVTGVEYIQEGSAQERSWRIDVTVRNYGPTLVSSVPLELRIGEQVVASALVDVEAGKNTLHTFRHRLDAPGLQKAEARLAGGDPLSADDVFHFTIHPREHVRALLVNGKPSSVSYDDELFFLLRALRPDQRTESAIVPTVTTVDGLETRELDGFDVVHLANVGRITPQVATKLHDYVEGGGGLVDRGEPLVAGQPAGGLGRKLVHRRLARGPNCGKRHRTAGKKVLCVAP
ncbi:MAG: BatA domain-containing protein [Bradymonadaceae bacterium]